MRRSRRTAEARREEGKEGEGGRDNGGRGGSVEERGAWSVEVMAAAALPQEGEEDMGGDRRANYEGKFNGEGSS